MMERSGETSGDEAMVRKERAQLIDVLRGIVILDMMLVHFNVYLPDRLARLISYTDFAMEGFLLLAGFSIGYHHLPRYCRERIGTTKKLIMKAVYIYKVQVLLILTINLPLYYIMYEKIRESETIWSFLGRSLLLLNQIGLIHILPTFIPLFLISPIILYCLHRGMSWWLCIGSVLLFLGGNRDPYILSLGDKPIFPVIVWQIYFVCGCVLGKKAWIQGRCTPQKINRCLAFAVIVLLIAVFIQHGKVVPPHLTSRFPLNLLGLLYGASILFTVFTVTAKWLGEMSKWAFVIRFLSLFGRHSLLAFVMHVYIAKLLGVTNYLWDLSRFTDWLCIAVSLLIIYSGLQIYESREKFGSTFAILKPLG